MTTLHGYVRNDLSVQLVHGPELWHAEVFDAKGKMAHSTVGYSTRFAAHIAAHNWAIKNNMEITKERDNYEIR